MAEQNDVILCVDVSGSVCRCEPYFKHIEEILEELKERCTNLPIICWSNYAQLYDVSNFEEKFVKKRQGDGGTFPQHIPRRIEEIIRDRNIEKFELIITTDGEISPYDTDRYCENVKNSNIRDKVIDIKLYFIGNPISMNTNLSHAFQNIPITMAINEHIVRSKRDFHLYKDERFTNFKLENISSLVDDLALELSMMPNTRENKTLIREMLDAIQKKYLKALFEMESKTDNPQENKKPEDIIHKLLIEGKMSELKKYYCELFTKQKDDIYDKKINKLYNLLHKDSVKCYDLMYFVPSAINTKYVQEQLENDDDVADETAYEMDSNSNYDRERFCAIYYIESSLPVIQLQKIPIAGILDKNVDHLHHEHKKLARCPLQLFDYIDFENLGASILADYISAEAFVNLSADKQPFMNIFTFKSSCNTETYGIMVYNFPNPLGNDLYEDKNSELFKEKTELDDNIVNHICCTIANYIIESREIRGNKGLWAIALLYSIYNTSRIQGNEFLKKCIRYTIIRISLVFKCNLPVFKGIHPRISINIHDALLCALHVASTVFKNENNFTRKLDESGPIFVQMMKTIFNQPIPEEINFDDWFSWKYLFRLSMDVKYRNVLTSIINTKSQDWINTDNGPLIIEGKTNDEVFNDTIKASKMESLYKMVKILKDKDIVVSKNFNFSKIKVDIPENIDNTKVISSCPVYLYKHIKLCETTCRPTYTCTETKKPWEECVPSELRKTQRSYFNLFGKYCYRYKKYPTVDDFLNHLVKIYPEEIHYKNVKEIITEMIEMFTALNLDVGEFVKRFRASTVVEKRIALESTCKCRAHT